MLERRGETIHPASASLASESEHFDREAGEHELNAFQALRRMDEILCANFMVFHDVVTEEAFDLWIGDEAWDVDHFLHENPELKTAAYAWLTDFVGFLPLPEGGEREAALTADYNAEMIEHVERFPRVRDRAIFVGEPEDIVPGTFGPGLPEIRAWTERHYDFCGYIPAVDSPRRPTARRFAPSSAGAGGDDLRRRRRRDRRRRTAAAAGGRGAARPARAGAGPADDRRRGSPDRSRLAARARRDSRSVATSTSCTASLPPATSPSSRAD